MAGNFCEICKNITFATDTFIYEEMITRIQPDTIVGKGGETFFELCKKNPSVLEYLLISSPRACMYYNDVLEILNRFANLELSDKAYHYLKIKEQIHKLGSSCPVIILTIKKDIPFIPDTSQVIYVENGYETLLNNYIQQNIKTISSLLKEKEKNFVYIPETFSIIKGNYSYYYPNPARGITQPTEISTNAITMQFFNYCTNAIDIQAGLIRYKGKDGNGDYQFSYFLFDKLEDTDFQKYFEWYVLALKDEHPVFPSAYFPEKIDYTDYQFDTHSKQLISEIRERIEILKQKGINEMVLSAILSLKPKVKMSRLVISKEYRILLPDFNNMEIEMYPLPKAIFLIFLAHPEGIKFKHLHVYKNDLINIYKQLSGRENIGDIEKSINDIVNPTLNSINEKCSRIREAFINKFDESIAQNYFITGKKGEPKKIMLDRSLLFLEEIELKSEAVKSLDDFIIDSHIDNYENDDLPF